MSQREPTEHERRQIRQPCPTCGARPGEWCSTRHGSTTAFLHARRPTRDTLPTEGR